MVGWVYGHNATCEWGYVVRVMESPWNTVTRLKKNFIQDYGGLCAYGDPWIIEKKIWF